MLTTFPDWLIEKFSSRLGPTYVADGIARHEDPTYVTGPLISLIEAYFADQDLDGARVLDFGCGSGGSTFALASRWPRAEVVGVELQEVSLELAAAVQEYRQLPNILFRQSAGPETLPENIGSFDLIVLSAVYEHLLPAERRNLLPRLWAVLKPGGSLVIRETPHRLCPYEHHSTGLFLINYLPDFLANIAATRFSRVHRQANRRRNWQEHLRGGIRGGTERGIVRDFTSGHPENAQILQPVYGVRSRAEFWLKSCSPRYQGPKRILARLFDITDRLFDCIPTLNIEVVIRKLR